MGLPLDSNLISKDMINKNGARITVSMNEKNKSNNLLKNNDSPPQINQKL